MVQMSEETESGSFFVYYEYQAIAITPHSYFPTSIWNHMFSTQIYKCEIVVHNGKLISIKLWRNGWRNIAKQLIRFYHPFTNEVGFQNGFMLSI